MNLAYGKGIYRCAKPRGAVAAIVELEAKKLEFILQEMVSGTDVDCSLIAEDGEIVAWTTQRGVATTRFAAPPTEIVMEPHPGLHAQVARLMRELRWSGVAHIDTILDSRDGTYRILELNGRFWGSLLASTAAGVNFPEIVLRRAAGLPAPAEAFAP